MPTPQASQFDHLSLALPDEDALHALRSRLKEAGCDVTDVVDHGIMRSIYFTDPRHRPRGVVLGDRRHRPPDRLRRQHVLRRPRPVPAVAELRARGEVDSIPATHLVDEVTRDIYKVGP